MKINIKIIEYAWIILILCSLFMMLTGCTLWGSPFFNFSIENHTQQILYISVDTGSAVEVKSGEILNDNLLLDAGKCTITAKNAEGEIYFSKLFTITEIEDLGKKIVIK